MVSLFALVFVSRFVLTFVWMFSFVLEADLRSPQLPEEEGDTTDPSSLGGPILARALHIS